MSISWLLWLSALTLFVFNCFWIIDQAYTYRKNVSNISKLKKSLHDTEMINRQLKVHIDHQLSLYQVEKSAKKQGLSAPQKIKIYRAKQP